MVSKLSRWAPVLLAWLIVAGCSSRDHINPFDPGNILTGGEPQLVMAAAGNGRVDLSWTIPGLEDIEAVRLVRSAGNDTFIVLPVDVPTSGGEWRDLTVTNDQTYRYALEFDFEGEDVSRRSAEALATPGSRVIWLLDQSGGGPLLISPDGRAVAGRPGQGRPTDMSVNMIHGGVVSVDFINRRVERFDRSGEAGAVAELLADPISVAIAEPSDSVWVATANPSEIQLWAPDLTVPTLADTGYGDAEDMAWDAARRSLWIADSRRGRLLHRRASGEITVLGGFTLPISVAIDAATGDAFLIDRARRSLFRVDADADTVLWVRAGFGGLYQALADPIRGGVWVSDNLAGTVTRVDDNGSIVRVIRGWEAPTGLALDPASGDLWMTDAGSGQLVRLSESGEVLQRLRGLNGPFAVAVAQPVEMPGVEIQENGNPGDGNP